MPVSTRHLYFSPGVIVTVAAARSPCQTIHVFPFLQPGADSLVTGGTEWARVFPTGPYPWSTASPRVLDEVETGSRCRASARAICIGASTAPPVAPQAWGLACSRAWAAK